ncbi:MAG TPA: lysophospholipid acyltransferase family protein [Smithella sp.]|nr:lysophospholipid acyltransferase family protein [Smithella sp.]
MFFKEILHRIIDFWVTLILWAYFLFGYLVILFLLYVPAYIFAEDSAAAFQNLKHLHLKCFFGLLRILVPRTKFDIPREVRNIHSAVIVCNHVSYLDPILLISIFRRQVTIVKQTFFKVPIFGWFLRHAGYVSSGGGDMIGPAMINHLEKIKDHIASGGVLFVFPEGTRSRDGRLHPFNKGVFTVARYCNAPLKLVFISGTNRLYPPGSFLFRTMEQNEIKLELIGSLDPDYRANSFSVSALADEARKIFEERADPAKREAPPIRTYR